MKPVDIKQLIGELDQTLKHVQTFQVPREVFKILIKVFWMMEQASDSEVETSLYQLGTLTQKYFGVFNKHFDCLLSFEALQNGDVVQNILQEVGDFLSLQGDLETCLFISSWPKECLNQKMIVNGGQSVCKGIIDVICRSKLNVKQISKLRDMITKVEVFLMTLFTMEKSLELFCLKEIFAKLFSFTIKCEKTSEPMLSLLVGGIMQIFDLHLISDVIHLCMQDLDITFKTSSTNQKELEENNHLIAVGSCIFHWMNLPYSSCISNIAIAYCRALVFNRRLVPLVNILTKEMDKLCLLIKLPITRKAALKLYVNLQLSFNTNPLFFNRHCDELTSLIAYLNQAKGIDVAFSDTAVQTLTLMVHCLLKFHPQMLISADNLMQVIEPHGQPTNEQLEKMLIDNISIFEVRSLSLSSFDATLMCTRGLLNLGNTCYINCIVQCLYACRSFSREILQSPLYSGQFAKSLQFTFANLLLSKRVVCTPNDIVNCSKKFFSFGLQHDCSEFLTYYLDQMSEEFSKNNGSLVSRNFHGSMRNTIRCLECNAQSDKRENFSSLSISIPAESQWLEEGIAHDLSGLVQDHFKQEILDGDNKYLCCKCNKMVRAVKSHFVVSPPEYLVIVLLRFHFDNQSHCRKKIKAPINCSKVVKLPFYEEELLGQISLSESSGQKCVIYKLKALTIHSGATLESGHYYSLFSCSEPASGEASWYLADDTEVRSISSQEFIRITSGMPMQTPYVLFLAREDMAHNLLLSELDVTPGLRKMVEEKNKEQKFRGPHSSNPTNESKSHDPKDDEDEFPAQMNFRDGPRLIF